MALFVESYSIDCILFDLEGITYDASLGQLTPEFCRLVQMCDDAEVMYYIATGASREEIDVIDALCGLYEYISPDNIFSCVQGGFETKADPLFFQNICKSKDLTPDTVMLIDDGINGITGARGVGIRTCYVGGLDVDSDLRVATFSDVFLLFSPIVLGNL